MIEKANIVVKNKILVFIAIFFVSVIAIIGYKSLASAWVNPAPECVQYKLSGRLFSCQAYHYLGTKESPANSNRGSSVDAFNNFGGCTLGSPWCASFLGYSFYQATGSRILTTCYTGDYRAIFEKYGKKTLNFTNGKYLHSGDYLYKQRPPGDGKGHVGVVYAVRRDNGDFTTIEGNTKCSGENNDCVRIRNYYASGKPKDSDNSNPYIWDYVLRWYPNEYPASPNIIP